MLKNTAPSITPSLTKLLNLSIQSGRFPEAWKLSSVVPISKGNEHESPSNYRPISLLSVTSKLLERHFHQLIADHLSNNHPLANTQWGFQPAKSTVSALLSTTHDWLEEMEAGRDICSVFLDLKKVFDTVPHQSLMEKLVRLNRPKSIHSSVVVQLSYKQATKGCGWRRGIRDHPSDLGHTTGIGIWSSFISNLH